MGFLNLVVAERVKEGNQMPDIKDIAGQRFGNWTVIVLSHVYSKRAHWLCRCDCGTVSVVRGDNLRLGKSNRCLNCRAFYRHTKGDIYAGKEG